MGAYPYKLLQYKFKNLSFTKDNLVLEIGSENGEGSSKYLHSWAYINNIDFISVDVCDKAKKNCTRHDIDFRVTTSGSEWCKKELPLLNKKIKVLYLDNFDWTWKAENVNLDWYKQMADEYASRGEILNNDNSQKEHRLQLEACLPYMDPQSVVIMDDTYTRNGRDWTGKCGTCISLLESAGYIVRPYGPPQVAAYAYTWSPYQVPDWIKEL